MSKRSPIGPARYRRAASGSLYRLIYPLLIWAFAMSGSATPGRAAESDAAEVVVKVRRFCDNLVEHARDRYGSEHTPLFVCQLDVATRQLPPSDSKLYASSGRGGAGPRMNNLQFDGGLLRLLYAMSDVTGDAKYADAADEYLRHYLESLPDEETGFFPWGDHRGYDVVADESIRAVHEFKCTYPPWDAMYRINPEAVTRQIESLRRHIVDLERSWGFNRHHPPGSLPHSMNSSGGAWIAAWAFLHTKTGDERYLDWAVQMADYLWSVRNPKTDLIAAHPFDPAYPEMKQSERAMARAGRTEYMGQITWFAANLLRVAELLGPEKGKKFREQGLAYYRAFTRRMDVKPDGSFYATFDLATGNSLFPRVADGWQYTRQIGQPHGWSNGVVPIRALFSLGFAYKLTGEEDLRETLDKLIPLAELEKFRDPDGPPEPIAAGLLAQVIVGFLNAYQGSGNREYLDRAWLLSRYALAHFYYDGWFVCGVPTVGRYRDPDVNVWRTYSNRGGSDDLALAVLRMHLVRDGKSDVAVDDVGCYF